MSWANALGFYGLRIRARRIESGRMSVCGVTPSPEPLRNPVVRLLLLAVDALGVNLEHDVARTWLAEQLDGPFRPVAPLAALLLRRALAPSLD
ncbi:hypothetical protein STREPTOSP366_70580 [Streptomyces variabilis]